MFVELTEVALPEPLWARAKDGELEALAEVEKLCTGMCIYEHALGAPESYTVVSVAELWHALRRSGKLLTLTIGFEPY